MIGECFWAWLLYRFLIRTFCMPPAFACQKTSLQRFWWERLLSYPWSPLTPDLSGERNSTQREKHWIVLCWQTVLLEEVFQTSPHSTIFPNILAVPSVVTDKGLSCCAPCWRSLSIMNTAKSCPDASEQTAKKNGILTRPPWTEKLTKQERTSSLWTKAESIANEKNEQSSMNRRHVFWPASSSLKHCLWQEL